MQAQLDALRERYFPAERNYLAAHLTLFHAIPADCQAQLAAELDEACALLPMPVRLAGLKPLGRGFAVHIESDALKAMHRRLQKHFGDVLTAQDRQGLWPHVTLQNKVAPSTAARDLAEARATFVAQPSHIVAWALWRYEGGPWSLVQRFAGDVES